MLKSLLILSLLTLSACGFQPVYGTINGQTPVRAELGTIEIANIPEESGQTLRNMLLDLGITNHHSSEYRLQFTPIRELRKSLGIDKDASATRSQLELTTSMTLVRLSDQKPLMVRNLRAVSSYNVLGSQFATLITRDDAREQALNELSQNSLNALELYFLNNSR